MKKLLLIALAAFGLLVLLAALAWWWLTGTRSGAEFVLGQVQSRVERLDWASLDGSLANGLTVNQFEFEQGGLTVDVERLELAVSIGLLPPFPVTVDSLVVIDPAVRTPPADPDAPSTPFELGDYRLPVPVTVRSARIEGLTVGPTETDIAAEPLRIDRIELIGRAFESLDLDTLSIQAPSGAIELNGQLGLVEPWALDLESRIRPAIAGVDQAADLALDGPLDALTLQATLRGGVRGTINAAAQGLPAIDQLTGRIDGEASLERWPGVDGQIEGIVINAEGGLANWRGRIDAQPRLDGVPVERVTLEANGNQESIRLSALRAFGLDGEVTASGQLNLGPDPTGTASVVFDQLDFTALYADWPSQARLRGRFETALTADELRITELVVDAEPTSLELTGQATVRRSDQHLDVALDWTDLAWPPVTDGTEPLFRSESGRFEGRGTLDEWRAEVGAWLQLPDQPPTRVEVDGTGDASSARVERGLLRPEGAGELRFTGRAGLQSPHSAALELVLEAFDPGALIPQLPGEINGTARLDIASATADLVIESLSGQLRGQPLSGAGQIVVRDFQVEEADVELRLGENRAVVQRPDPSAWTVAVTAPRLGQLWPGLSGGLEAEATVEPPRRALDWTLAGSELIFGGRRAAQLDSRGTLSWGEQPAATVRLTADDVDLNPWERLHRVELSLTGDCAQHRFNALANGTRATLDLAGGGAFSTCSALDGDWSGQIDRLRIQETDIGPWQLSQPLAIARSDGRLLAETSCLWTADHPGRLCLTGLDAGPSGSASMAFNAVPMNLVLLPLDPAFSIGADLRGLARVEWDPEGLQTLDARILMDQGDLTLLGVDDTLLTIDGIDIAVQSPEPRTALATLDLGIEGQSRISGEMRIPNLHRPAEATVDGRLELALPRLAAFSRLAPQLDDLEGRLDAELMVRGPLATPGFEGSATLSQGRIRHAPLGLHLEAIELTLTGDEQGGQLNGAFVAGEGRGEIGGELRSDAAGWSGEMIVDGEQLALFDADWLQLKLSSNLVARFDPEQLALDGTVTIDQARLGLPPGTAERIEPSPDVVIVGAEASADDAAAPRAPRPIEGQVVLQLGDDVRLEAAGMRTRLTGGLEMRWQGEQAIPVASGRINLVDGAYRAYGQNLDVQRGEVTFTGNPIDNPVLDIAAAREIFGDPVVEFAGVQIRGPAQAPEIELYTLPPTSREKALAYVLTGAEFDHAAGQGAFNVGFFVLPEIFVSYGVGLFDTGNVLAARWDFAERWGLKATSGEADTGADLSFIIDR